jgi:hypothetical protein
MIHCAKCNAKLEVGATVAHYKDITCCSAECLIQYLVDNCVISVGLLTFDKFCVDCEYENVRCCDEPCKSCERDLKDNWKSKGDK